MESDCRSIIMILIRKQAVLIEITPRLISILAASESWSSIDISIADLKNQSKDGGVSSLFSCDQMIK